MGTSVSSAAMARIRTFAAALAAFLLTLGLAPAFAFADDVQAEASSGVASTLVDQVNDSADSSSVESQQVSALQDAGASRVAPMLASGLFGSPVGIISSDVALDAADPVVGSFTVDGLTYAVGTDGVTLVAVDSAAVSDGAVGVPATIAYNGTTYDVTVIGPYAFYLSGATSVELPDSIASVDSRAFRSSDVARIDVAPGNPNIASYEGALYSADLTSLLLIPEGRAGSVPIPSEAEVVDASKFSHCSLVDAISVDGDGADFASWDGLLYDASGTTLLRAPAGATEITIRDGCTAIAAGALEGCAKLERINAPVSVTSISPDIFESVPTISLPIASALQDDSQVDSVAGPLAGPGYEGDARSASADSPAEGEEEMPGSVGAQLTAMVAVGVDEAVPAPDPHCIEVCVAPGAAAATFAARGFKVIEEEDISGELNDEESVMKRGAHSSAVFATAQTYKGSFVVKVNPNGHTIRFSYRTWKKSTNSDYSWRQDTNSATTWSIGEVTSWRVKNNSALQLTQANKYYQGNSDINYFYIIEGVTPGWSLQGWSRSASGSMLPANDAFYSSSDTLYAIWRAHTYTISFDSQGGSVLSNMGAIYDQNAMLPAPTRAGYAFQGWDTKADGTGTRYQAGAIRNLTATDKATIVLYAQWSPAISAAVPVEVTAKVDLLGIEEQQEASGYVESRCGEPLKVAEVAMEPLSGATDLFGAGNEPQVQLQALAGQGATWQPGGANASFSFSLGASATESDAGKLAALAMGAYGERIPISYRFDIPEALLPTLSETTKPVCQVVYTVALA